MYHTHVHQPHTHSIPDTGVLGDSNDNKDFRSGGGGICEEQEVTWLRRRVQKLELQAADDAREGGREGRKRGSETEGGQEGGSVWEEDIYSVSLEQENSVSLEQENTFRPCVLVTQTQTQTHL
jgi:hypothetical protein